jgi:hypothetical protein
MIYIYLTIENVNDAPTGEWGTGYAAMINKKTGEEVNVSVDNLMDVDGDDLTVSWKIDGTLVTGWNMDYFLYNWSTAKIYNVSAYVSDGIETVEIGYFHVNVTIANTAPDQQDRGTDRGSEGWRFLHLGGQCDRRSGYTHRYLDQDRRYHLGEDRKPYHSHRSGTRDIYFHGNSGRPIWRNRNPDLLCDHRRESRRY